MYRALAWLLFLFLATPAQGAMFGFGFVGASTSVGAGGSGTAAIKIPGTFSALNDADPTKGRYLKDVEIYASATSNGDAVSALQIIDQDGVIPAPARVLFPNYPVIFDLIDGAVSGNSGILISSNGYHAEALDSSGLPSTRFIPSGLYLKATFQNGNGLVSKTFNMNIRWGIWQ